MVGIICSSKTSQLSVLAKPAGCSPRQTEGTAQSDIFPIGSDKLHANHAFSAQNLLVVNEDAHLVIACLKSCAMMPNVEEVKKVLHQIGK